MLMTMPRAALLLHRRFRQLSGDDRGISAVEFGLLAPIMVGLYLASVTFSQGIAIQRKATLAAHAVADLVSQGIAINNDGEIKSILNAVDRIIEPYPKDKFKVTISQVIIDDKGVAKIQWSDSRNTTQRTQNQVVTNDIPASFRACAVAPCYLLWGEAEYDYVPVLGKSNVPPGSPPGTPGTVEFYLMGHKFTMPALRQQSFTRPRQTASVSQAWAGKNYPR
ncbi:MAG: TadE/TadG family type IV pilus assembly protein [Xanthobacteraceae bacterium]